MKRKIFYWITLAIGTTVPVSIQAADIWQPLTDPIELRDLLIGKTFEHGDYIDVYHQDGVMGSLNIVKDTVVTRTWDIKDDGRFCYYLFLQPDHLVDCLNFSQSSTDPNLLMMRILRGEGSFSMSGTLSEKQPPAKVLRAISEAAETSN